MRKPPETAADSVWREALASCATSKEAIVLLALMAALALTIAISA